MGTWDWQKSKNQKKAPGFLPPAQLLPPHHLLTLSTSDTMQHEKMDQQCSMFTSPSVFFCPQSSFAPQYGDDDDDDQYGVLYCTWVQHCGHCGGDDDVVPHSMGQHQCSTPTRWSTVQWCCAQHSTAVKSIGSIISRGSIIASSHAAAFFDFCKEWVELPLWGRWNYFFWFFLFLHLQGGCKYPQNQKIAFFWFLGVSGTPKIKKWQKFRFFGHLGLPPGHCGQKNEKFFLLRSFLQLPRLRLGPLKGFLSWHGAHQGPSSPLVSCFRNYGVSRTPSRTIT